VTGTESDISVIIPAYNAADTLALCIHALDKQQLADHTYEIIVVNDCSTDTTASILAQLDIECAANLEIIHHPQNQGRSAARNSGIKAAQGRILIFLDADLEVPPDFIAQHFRHYQNEQVVGVSGTTIPAPDIPLTKYQRYLYQAKRGARKYDPDRPLHYSAFLFNNCSVRKKAFRQTGLFDEKIRHYGGEDTEMAFRIWRKYPHGLSHDPQITACHHHYRSFGHVLDIIEKFGARVVPYLVQKHPELAALYHYDMLQYRFGLSNPVISMIKLFLGRIVRTRISQKTLYILYYLSFYPLSNYIIKVLMASALLRGIANAPKTQKSA